MESFRIESIKIEKDCDKKYCKILKTDCEYKFYSDETTEKINLYGNNINICALVGKNGSGKSSLLDMLYRIVSNFGYLLFRGTVMPAAETPFFLERIHASIKFKYADKRLELKCEDKDVSLCLNSEVIWTATCCNREIIKDTKTGKYKGEFDIFNSDDKDVAKKIFYTIVANYSIQSLNYEDYEDEGPWIQKLFHKNDGYSHPIVLNPYRHDYGINTEIEAELTNYRLSAIFLNSTKEKSFIEGYNLNRLEYHYSPIKYYLNIYRDYLKTIQDSKIKKESEAKDYKQIISFINGELLKAYQTKGSCANLILKHYFPNLRLSEDSSESYKAACVYIVYKVLSSTKYPDYALYHQNFHKLEYCIACEAANSDIQQYINEIKEDNSHITNKLQQTIQFVENYDSIENKIGKVALNNENESFDFDSYLGEKQLPDNILGIIKLLPPPFYKVQIYLDRNQGNESKQGKSILFSKLSSGEKQFAYMMSTYIYHLANLKSVLDIPKETTKKSNGRIAYHLINMIFDEMELCFHPEYQRTFVNNLVSYIKRTGLNEVFSFNIILTTHSPFILSDIPACNILALKDGQPDKSFIKERTFAANIYDILGNSFFMDRFIGEFASETIGEIVQQLVNDKGSLEGEQKIKNTIELIGDEVMRIKLLEKLDQRTGNKYSINERKKILQKELDKLNSK